MAIFDKENIDPSLVPLINEGKEVGVVKLEGYGKTSVALKDDELVFKSYEGKNIPKLKLLQITSLTFHPGNFINEPKLLIGINNQTLEIKGVDDNDTEFERFYNTILKAKKDEPEPVKYETPDPAHPQMQPPYDTVPEWKKPVNEELRRSPMRRLYPMNMDTPLLPVEDTADAIRRFHELYKDGIITKEEFEAKKQRLLNL